jgi:putative PIN family toxin of toxin-antitoxin system
VLCTSPILLAELADVIGQPEFAQRLRKAGLDGETLIHEFERLAEFRLAAPLSRDPDDDHVLACAVAANADFIVSGDDDLLSLRENRGDYRGFVILTAAQACQRLSC